MTTLNQTVATDGLVYLNNRYHDPALGQFISVDPLVTRTGEAYAYGAANPATYSDPLGLEVCYDRGPLKGFCYEAADGEGSAMTRQEELLTVMVPSTLTNWVGPDGEAYRGANVRCSELSAVGSDELVDTWRLLGAADRGGLLRLTGRESAIEIELANDLLTDLSSWLTAGEIDPMEILVDTVGDLADLSGYIATVCTIAAVSGVGAYCAGVAGAVSTGLGAVEVGLGALTGRDSTRCDAAGLAVDVILPDVPVPGGGDVLGPVVINSTKNVAGHVVDVAC